MNSNHCSENLFVAMSPLFTVEPSPYLSPLFGSISNVQPSSHDDLDDFHLEEEPALMLGGDPDPNSLDVSFS